MGGGRGWVILNIVTSFLGRGQKTRKKVVISFMDGPVADLLLQMTALTFFKSEEKKIGKLKINKIKITIIKLYRS